MFKYWQRGNPKFLAFGMLAILMCSSLCCIGFFFAVTGAVKSSDAYTLSVQKVRAHPEVQQAVGVPMEPSTIVMGHVRVTDDSGSAALTYDMEGDKGRAAIEVVAVKDAGQWVFKRLVAVPDKTNKEINVLPAPKSEDSPQP